MNPPTYIYIRIYTDKNYGVRIYTGITTTMKNRQQQHNKNLTRTTNRFNKAFKLKEIRYIELDTKAYAIKYEKTFKNYTDSKKLKVSKNWMRWVG